MAQIDITEFVTYGETWDFTGSVATHGPNAGPNTWNAAKKEAASNPLLKTEEHLQALRDHVQAMGFGHDVQTYDAVQCNALFIQLVSGDLREMGLEDCEVDEFDWIAHSERAQAGEISSNIYKCDLDGSIEYGRIFYSLES